MARIRARFNPKTVTTDVLRDALIEDNMEDVTDDDIEMIIDLYWEEFRPLALRWMDRKYSDGNDVWQLAEDKGWFEEDYVEDDR